MNRKGFMAGCALSSYSPIGVKKSIEYLKTAYPNISVIQKCCGKPTKAIGQRDKFEERYNLLLDDIKYCELDEMIVGCQNCYKILNQSEGFKTISLWQILAEVGLPENIKGKAKNSDVVFSIHDSCSTRNYKEIHNGIRTILNELGYKVSEPEKTRENTRCCGFGGMIAPVNPKLSRKVRERRVNDFKTDHIVTYCAACRQAMTLGGGSAWHILDLIWGDVVYKNSIPPKDVLSTPLKAWINRYKTKDEIKKTLK